MKKKGDVDGSWAEVLMEKLTPTVNEPVPTLSLIIPVYNCSERIGVTLESVGRQRYPKLEVIVVDASSTDKTLEIVNSYHDLVSRIYTVTDYNPFDMINRGLSLASGRYLTFLLPGSSYLNEDTYLIMAQRVQKEGEPDALYCGSIQRESHRDPRLVHRPFSLDLMKQGMQPAVLSACWMRADLFETVGKFLPQFTLRSGFEFLCRLANNHEIKVVRVGRVLIDFDYGHFSYAKLIRYATDTWRILVSNFGLWCGVRWFLGVNHLNIFRWWIRNLKLRLFRR